MSNIYQEKYEQTLQKLNPEQLEAVSYMEGPMLVIAGPGTGKTQMLTSRIAYILQNTDASPSNILCLTFTDAGATAMKKRLTDMIGVQAQQVQIHTFHSFCGEVIRSYPSYFDLKNQEPLSDLDKIEIMQEVLDNADISNKLIDPKNRFKNAQNLLYFFNTIKKEAFDIEELKKMADKHIEFVNTSEEYEYKIKSKLGQKKQNDIDKEVAKMEKFKDALSLFPIYMELLKEKGRYDFDDMILWTIEFFKQKPDFLASFQEKYQYILVDEYQDTSGSQNEILRLLIEHEYIDKPNVFVVGDDDQSIYRFQGANIQNIEEFSTRFFPKKVVLKRNYRSNQQILNAALDLIKNNKDRLVNKIENLDLNKDLIASNPQKISDKKISVWAFENPYAEEAFIANEIIKLNNENPEKSIAVLYKKHKCADNLIKYLTYKNISFDVKKEINLLDVKQIKQILMIMEYVKLENKYPYSGGHLLFEILHADFFGLKPEDIALIAYRTFKHKEGELKKLRHNLAENIKKESQTLFDTNIYYTSDFNKAFLFLEELIVDAFVEPLPRFLQKIYKFLGMYENCVESNDYLQIEIYTCFYNYVCNYTLENSNTTMDDFLAHIQKMKDFELSIPFYKSFSGKNNITFSTFHSSKGMEFDTVFLIDSSEGSWNNKAPVQQISYPPELKGDKTEEKANNAEEDRRLFFVGITRAEENLLITYADKNESGKEQLRAHFLDEIHNTNNVVFENKNVSLEEITAYQNIVLLPDIDNSIKLGEITELFLKNYSLSVTHLNEYLRCPYSFYFNYVLKIPQQQNVHLLFGSVVHQALYEFYINSAKTPNKSFLPASELVNLYAKNLEKYAAFFKEHEYKDLLTHGAAFLPKYYQENIQNWNIDSKVEKNISTEIDGISINGKIDKMILTKNEAIVTDYKTGKSENISDKLKRPKPEDVDENPLEKLGGDYWRQAVFYRLLLKQEGIILQDTIFDFVEPSNKNGKFTNKSMLTDLEDEEMLLKQMKATWHAIHQNQFSRKCNSNHCKWCFSTIST